MENFQDTVKHFYDDFADHWDERFNESRAFQFFLHKRLDMLRKYIDTTDVHSVIDAGTGTGFYVLRLLRSDQKGLGFDVSENMLSQARKIKSEAFPDLDVDFVKEDGEHLSVADNTFDASICVGYLVHLENPQQALNELYRVLKPGGRLVGLVSNRWSPWLLFKLRKIFAKDFGVLPTDHEFSPPEIRDMMLKSGFKNVEVKMFNTLPGMLPNWAYYPARALNLIFSVWPFNYFGFHILIVGTK